MFKKNYLLTLTIILAVFLIAPGCGNDKSKMEEDLTGFKKLDWMTGIWRGKQGNADIYESWTRKNSRILEGISYTTLNGKRIYSQSMTIEQSNNIIHYIIKIKGENEQTDLKASDVTENKVVFKNTEDKYPKRIIYEKLPKNKMSVLTEGEEGKTENSTELIYMKDKNSPI